MPFLVVAIVIDLQMSKIKYVDYMHVSVTKFGHIYVAKSLYAKDCEHFSISMGDTE